LTFHDGVEMEVALCEWLQIQETNFYHDVSFFKLKQRWAKWIVVPWDYG